MEEKEKLLAEIKQYISIYHQQEGDVTAQEVAKELGISVEGARRKLNKLVEQGKLATRIALNSKGRWVRVYYRKEEKKWS